MKKMNKQRERSLDRRSFLTGSLGLVGGASLLTPSARAGMRFIGPRGEGRTLILIQLSGGNDGLSTLVPYGDDAYHKARNRTRIAPEQLHKIDDYLGFHPGLQRLHARFAEGQLGVVQGVGYPGPTRSHFKSREIWHAASLRGRAVGDGWVGRLCDDAWADSTLPELTAHIGRSVPFSLHSAKHQPVAFETPELYRWFGDRDAQQALKAKHSKSKEKQGGSVLDRLRRVMDDAQDSSVRIRSAVANYRTDVVYPNSEFANNLRHAAALLDARLGTRVISIETGGFDTHNIQKGPHSDLMRDLDRSLDAFLTDIARSEAGKHTLVVAFSEFGRRVAENGSQGTDHGKAGPVFVAGAAAKGGLYGEHPSLTDLDKGDLKFNVDFRQTYAATINWLGGDADAVLGAHYEPVPFVKS